MKKTKKTKGKLINIIIGSTFNYRRLFPAIIQMFLEIVRSFFCEFIFAHFVFSI